MEEEHIYQLALALVPHIGDVQAGILVRHFGDARSIFHAPAATLEKIEGIGSVRARAIRDFNDFESAEKELRFVEDQGIRMLFLTDDAYPRRLLNCYDAPPLLFYLGDADLNASRLLAIVGTRSMTEYGKQVTSDLVKGLTAAKVTIVSGLAYGIDAVAHQFALTQQLPTIGVVGHGLDTVYPYAHAQLAKEMVRQGGGMLSEFFSGTGPDRHHFPLRNRIVAGITDATVVVETHVKGGSMITAKLADAYNRDVFAVPGRVTDFYSSGCNHLIQHNKAMVLNNAAELLQVLGWSEQKKERNAQRALFIDLTAEEQQVLRLLQEKDAVHIDEINLKGGLSSSAAAAAVLNLELQNLITALPGKMYRLV